MLIFRYLRRHSDIDSEMIFNDCEGGNVMKAKFKPIVIIVLVIIVILGLFKILIGPKSIESFCDMDSSKISSITSMNGNTGDMHTVTSEEAIHYLTHYLSQISMIRVFEPASTGWSYRFTIYEASAPKLDVFVNDNYIEIGKAKYKIITSANEPIADVFKKFNDMK